MEVNKSIKKKASNFIYVICKQVNNILDEQNTFTLEGQ